MDQVGEGNILEDTANETMNEARHKGGVVVRTCGKKNQSFFFALYISHTVVPAHPRYIRRRHT